MKLGVQDRMNLMKFVCSFAWTDLKVTRAERDLVMRIAGQSGLTDAEVRQVAAWLEVPPLPDEIDPTRVPVAHRRLFLQAAEQTVGADRLITPAERDQLAVFRELLDS